MAKDMSAAPRPSLWRFALATTWTKVTVPASCRVTIGSETTKYFLAFASNGDPASPETPADGGSVGSHYFSLPADQPLSFRHKLGPRSDDLLVFFVAGNGGTPQMTVMVEDLEE